MIDCNKYQYEQLLNNYWKYSIKMKSKFTTPKDLNIMQDLFRLLLEAFNFLFFDFFLCSFPFLASEVLDFEPMW